MVELPWFNFFMEEDIVWVMRVRTRETRVLLDHGGMKWILSQLLYEDDAVPDSLNPKKS